MPPPAVATLEVRSRADMPTTFAVLGDGARHRDTLGLHEAAYRPRGGRLAGAIGAEDRDDLPGFSFQ